MQKKIIACIIASLGIILISTVFDNTMQASGMITGSNNHEAGNSLQLGEQVHMGGMTCILY